jgi:hypothetical protein
VSDNASADKKYTACSLVRFEVKKVFFGFEKNALAYYSAGIAAANSEIVGSDLRPVLNFAPRVKL